LIFDTNTGDYASFVHIAWYRDEELITSADYYPNNVKFFCQQDIIAYNKITLTFKKMNKPYRYLRIFDIEDGITREFYNDEIKSLKVLEEISLTTENLSVNTLDFQVKTKNDIGVLFQKTLPLKLYRNESLVGAFFIEQSEKETGNTYKISATDYIGLLDNEKFLGGMYVNESVGNIVASILEDIPYTIESELATRTISGYIEILSKREALQKLIFSAGGIIDCSRAESIEIKLLNHDIISTFDKGKIVSIKEITESITTSIELTEHKYKLKKESEKIVEDTISGETLISFSAPYTSLSMTGGTIISSGINYVLVNGNGDVTITGIGYDDISIKKNKRNPLTVTTDIEKVKSYNTTLICNEISLIDNLKFINKTLTVKLNLENYEKVGDKINILGQDARITNLDYELNTPSIYATAEMQIET